MDLRKEEVWAPRVLLEHSCLDEQNELLSDSFSPGRSFAWNRSFFLLFASSRGYRGLADNERARARLYAVFALNHDDFYDLDPLTSGPSPIPLLYGDNSSLSYIVAAKAGPVSQRFTSLI